MLKALSESLNAKKNALSQTLVRWVRPLWSWVSKQGITDTLSEDRRSKIILTNRLAATVSLMLIGPLFNYIQVLDAFILHFLAILSYLMPIFINRWGWHSMARWWFVLTPPVFNLMGAGLLTEGPASAAKISFMSMIILPILLFQITEWFQMLLGLGWVFLTVLSFDYVTDLIPRSAWIANDAHYDNPQIAHIGIIRGMLMLTIAFIYLQLVNRGNQQKLKKALDETDRQRAVLDDTNALLRQQNEEIERQRLDIEHINHDLRLQALKAQMDPHFLFNALGSIQHFILKQETKESLNYLAKFSKLIRQMLENSVNDRVSLADETRALSYYIDLERLRFENKFEYHIDIDETIDAERTEIPPMLLQPYIENAILHGLRPKEEGGGQLKVVILRQFDDLLCVIEDNGIGREAAAYINSHRRRSHISRGTSFTDSRIRLLNANRTQAVSAITIDLMDEDENPRGTRVELKIPL